MKVAKEQIIGMVAALDWFLDQTDAGMQAEYRSRADRIVAQLKGIPTLTHEVIVPPLANATDDAPVIPPPRMLLPANCHPTFTCGEKTMPLLKGLV